MRFCVLACAMTVVMVSVTRAADRPSPEVLGDMGLGNLVMMSDNDALAVRGMGWSPVRAKGHSWASIMVKGASAGSENSYSAKGGHKAWGETNSEAGVEISHGEHTKSITVFAGGSSRAGRK